jgi:uncharacterized protein YbjT (DUF2867 family)
MKIVVIGGTGLVGSKVVEKLRNAGHDPLAASPDTGVNTLTGEGLDDALEGAQVVVDVSNAPVWEDDEVMDFFLTSARNLLAAETAARVDHHVLLSVVGADRMPGSGYMRAKVAQEEKVTASSVPYTILRACQFFEFIARIADSTSNDEAIDLAPALIQPQASDDVAATVADLAPHDPLNGIVELGAEQFRLDELVRRVLRDHEDVRLVRTDVHAPYFGAELEENTLIPGPGARIAPTRLEEWLEESVRAETPTR